MTFSSTFATLDLAAFSDASYKATFETNYKAAVATAAGVTAEQVVILNYSEGSVVVDSAILVTDQAAGEAVAAAVTNESATMSTALAAYGAVVVSAPEVQVITSPPPSPFAPSTLDFTVTGSAAGGGVGLLAALVAVLVSLLRL